MTAGSFALRLARAALAGVIAGAVAGCGAAPGVRTVAQRGPPWVTALSPDTIVLRWYPRQTPARAAERIAEAHCAGAGRVAVLVSQQDAEGARIAQYDCR
jgi:hypothetical protein